MGYFKMSPGVAVLSLGLLALVGCRDAGQDTKQATLAGASQGTQIIICPGDRRCGQMDPISSATAATCRANQVNLKFKCGERELPCPGEGCPTGEPGLEDQHCWISETFVKVANCGKATGADPVADGTAEPVPTPTEPAEPPPAQ